MKIFTPSGGGPSDPCECCTNNHIFTCIEDCENLTVRNARENPSDLLPAIPYQQWVLFPHISIEQVFYSHQAPDEANAALDFLQSVVLLN